MSQWWTYSCVIIRDSDSTVTSQLVHLSILKVDRKVGVLNTGHLLTCAQVAISMNYVWRVLNWPTLGILALAFFVYFAYFMNIK